MSYREIYVHVINNTILIAASHTTIARSFRRGGHTVSDSRTGNTNMDAGGKPPRGSIHSDPACDEGGLYHPKTPCDFNTTPFVCTRLLMDASRLDNVEMREQAYTLDAPKGGNKHSRRNRGNTNSIRKAHSGRRTTQAAVARQAAGKASTKDHTDQWMNVWTSIELHARLRTHIPFQIGIVVFVSGPRDRRASTTPIRHSEQWSGTARPTIRVSI